MAQNQIQIHSTKGKQEQLSSQQKKQILTNDLLARLLAELEASINCSNKNFQRSIPQDFLSSEKEDKFFYLENIEIILISLEAFCKPGDFWDTPIGRKKGAEINIQNKEYLHYIKNQLTLLDLIDPVRIIGLFVLNQLYENKIAQLPKEYCELIKSQQQRDREVEYLMKNDKSGLLKGKWMADKIEAAVSERIGTCTAEMAKPQVLQVPLFDNKNAPEPKEHYPGCM